MSRPVSPVPVGSTTPSSPAVAGLPEPLHRSETGLAQVQKSPPTVGLVIRFKNSAATLPGVLAAIGRQTVRPDLILAINNQSADESPQLLQAAGAQILDWTEPYHHSRVVNFAMSRCPTDLVLMLSSHTVLESPDAIESLVKALADPRTACASGKWDADTFYSNNVDWAELQSKGLKFGSIYSNSMGMVRRALWEQVPFDESLVTMEDSAWALEQIKRGNFCRRLDFKFSYQRGGRARDFVFAVITFKLAARHGLRVTWLGVKGTLLELLRGRRADSGVSSAQREALRQRLRAWALWRFIGMPAE